MDPRYPALPLGMLAAVPRDYEGAESLRNPKGIPYALLFRCLFERFAIQPRGILHCGGHLGQEIVPYLMLGYRNVLFVEPSPEVYKRLEANIAYTRSLVSTLERFTASPSLLTIDSVRCAVGDREGTVMLNVHKNSQETSMLDFIDDPFVTRVEAPLRTIDGLLDERRQTQAFDVLYLNIQGAELAALNGAVRTLASMRLVFAEVNLTAQYVGAPTPADIEAFIVQHGFRIGWRCGGLDPRVGYDVYVRSDAA